MTKLSFPTNWGESQERPFRDGTRVVPEYLADMMGSLDTSQLTYDQAVKLANSGLVGSQFDKAREKMISQHFNEGRDGRRA